MNEVLMHLRSRRRRNARIVSGVSPDVLEEIGPLTEAAPWEHRAATRQRDTRVRAAIRALPEEWRSVVEAYYDEDLPLHDVAARLSLSESAARTRLHRARRLLRTQLDGDGWAREARSELAEPRRRAA
jgi:RNA polymerase sigma-70 factor (ECF subfamily)